MERKIGVALLLHAVAVVIAINESVSTNSSLESSTILSQKPAAVDSNKNQTIIINTSNSIQKTDNLPVADLNTTVNLPGTDVSLVNVTLDLLNPPVQGDGTKKTSVPRKGIKEPIKPRKGATLPPELNITTSNLSPKFKPLASETQKTEDEVSVQPDYTALIVGLSLGIALVLILASVTYWRLRDVWERRQYKRVDFLIDGLYTDT